MSHFSEIKTKMDQLDMVQKTCAALGLVCEFDPQGLPIRGFMGDTVTAEIRIGTGTTYDIGLRKSAAGQYEFVADFEVLDKMPESALKQKIIQKYAHLQVRHSLEEQGYAVEEEVQKDGTIQMVVSQW